MRRLHRADREFQLPPQDIFRKKRIVNRHEEMRSRILRKCIRKVEMRKWIDDIRFLSCLPLVSLSLTSPVEVVLFSPSLPFCVFFENLLLFSLYRSTPILFSFCLALNLVAEYPEYTIFSSEKKGNSLSSHLWPAPAYQRNIKRERERISSRDVRKTLSSSHQVWNYYPLSSSDSCWFTSPF